MGRLGVVFMIWNPLEAPPKKYSLKTSIEEVQIPTEQSTRTNPLFQVLDLLAGPLTTVAATRCLWIGEEVKTRRS